MCLKQFFFYFVTNKYKKYHVVNDYEFVCFLSPLQSTFLYMYTHDIYPISSLVYIIFAPHYYLVNFDLTEQFSY